MPKIPKKYQNNIVLRDIIWATLSVKENWERVQLNYETVLDWLDKNKKDIDIDRKLVLRFKKDIRNDGAGFIETQDGVASRINDWLEEAFPQCFR